MGSIAPLRPPGLRFVARLVCLFFATRRATFWTRLGLTFFVARPIRIRFAFAITRPVTVSARLAIARLVPIGASRIGTTFAVTRWLPSTFGRTITLRTSVTVSRPIPFARPITIAWASAVWSTLRWPEQLRRIELAVFVVIQFAEDFFQPIELIAAEPSIFVLVEQLKEPRHRASTAFPLRRRTVAVWATITFRRTIALQRPFAGTTLRTAITVTPFAFARTITLGATFAIAWRLAFASSFRALPIWLRIGATIAIRLAITIAARFPFASLSHRSHIIQRQHVFLRTFKHRPHAVTELLRDFFERDFAVAVRVHPLELLFGILIRSAPWITRGARRRTQFGHRAADLFL